MSPLWLPLAIAVTLLRLTFLLVIETPVAFVAYAIGEPL